jgi:hypothetical protein
VAIRARRAAAGAVLDSVDPHAQAATLEADPRRLLLGQPVRIVLRLHDASLVQQQRESVAATVHSSESSGSIPAARPLAELTLRKVEGSDDQFATTWRPAEAGELTIRIDEPDFRSLNLRATLEVFRPDDELRHAESDHALLASLAAETGGAVLGPEELGRLPGLLPNRSVRTVNPLVESIWDTPLAFGLVLLLLAGEWIGRKLIRLI